MGFAADSCDDGGNAMEDLIASLNEINKTLNHIWSTLAIIQMWLAFMVLCKDMGHDASRILRDIRDKIGRK